MINFLHHPKKFQTEEQASEIQLDEQVKIDLENQARTEVDE